MNKTNRELVQIFQRMGEIYELKGDNNQFRIRAYENASRVLDSMAEDVKDIWERGEKLEELHGIGASIAKKIVEYIQTGKIKKYEELKQEIPDDFFELLKVEGLGPKKLQRLRKELNVHSKQDLIEALESGKVAALEGFGQKTVDNMLKGIAQLEQRGDRILLAEAVDIAEEIKQELFKCCEPGQIEIAGSVRRRKSTIGDIDVLVTAGELDRDKIMNCFTSMHIVSHVIAKGKKKSSVQIKLSNRDVDLRIFSQEEFGAAMLYFTGSQAHNVRLRKLAQERQWKVNEYGLYAGEEKIAGKTEEEIYQMLGLKWIPPELREDQGEIEWAKEKDIPGLIQFEDIRGDLHLHSDWSDGRNTIREIAGFVKDHYKYDYLVLTDHSKSQTQANGLNENRIRKQWKEIDEANESIEKDLIKRGIEVDIMPDGSLDLPDDLLKELDWVVASIHSRFKQDNTDRILAAMDNPYVNAIGHPSGRLLNQREPYELDMEKVIEHTVKTGTALEINTSPSRMDLDEKWIRSAQEQGAMLIISTDSHALGQFAFMKLGTGYARRGWCTPDHVLNTQSWDNIQAFVKNKREKLR